MAAFGFTVSVCSVVCARLSVFSPEVPPAPARSQGFGGDKPDMLMGVAL